MYQTVACQRPQYALRAHGYPAVSRQPRPQPTSAAPRSAGVFAGARVTLGGVENAVHHQIAVGLNDGSEVNLAAPDDISTLGADAREEVRQNVNSAQLVAARPRARLVCSASSEPHGA